LKKGAPKWIVMSELVVRKRDLTAQEYYEIYLKSKQEGDDRKKSSQCLLARGGSFRIKPEEKAHAVGEINFIFVFKEGKYLSFIYNYSRPFLEARV